ncbi:hypothetical protein ACTG9Q_05380 [Actinokineospora sp. 24-640]
MDEIFRLIETESRRLTQHALFTDWLRNDAIPASEKLIFTPMTLDFIMGFRDLNKHFIRYSTPKNDLELTINSHSSEDETHSALMLVDWASLDMDSHLGWAPRDLYWWLTCDKTAPSRRVNFEIASLMYHHPDPLFRFALVESMEEAGKVFFTQTVPIVDKLGPDESFPYYGRYHLERETGHLQGGDERPFRQAVLSPAQRSKAGGLVSRVFEIFHFHFSEWHEYARDVREKRWTFDARTEGRSSASLRESSKLDVTSAMRLEHPASGNEQGENLKALSRNAFDELWQAPAYVWMRETWPGDFRRMTRYFLLQWVVDNWACADYFQFDTTYADPESALGRGMNRLSALYASEMRCRYTEWEELELDAYTQWTTYEALRHYWLDEGVEEHRRIFAELRKLTFQHPEPIYRYWILKCFVRFGDAMIDSLGVAMRRAGEDADKFAMFAGQRERMHPDLDPDPEADEAIMDLERQPLTPENVRVIENIIATTRDQERERADVTWRVVSEHRYAQFDQRWAAR